MLSPSETDNLLNTGIPVLHNLLFRKPYGNVETRILKANLYILVLGNPSFFCVVHIFLISEDL